MLTPNILNAYSRGVDALKQHAAVEVAGEGESGSGHQGQAILFSVTGADFLEFSALREEVFGSASVIVRCESSSQLMEVLGSLEGQLTAALHVADEDLDIAKKMVPILELRAGRILVNGFGTGVEVGHAMVHGGPFPATSDARSTSVGSLAINRFLRPVSYQDFPDDLLPAALRNDNPEQVPQRVDGVLQPR